MHRRAILIAGAVSFGALLPSRAPRAEGAALTFREMYVAGMEFSEKVKELNGQTVRLQGYMAPPLKPESSFFILTKIPMAVCPFCDNEADWPDDIVLCRMPQAEPFVAFNRRIEVEGTLEIGTDVDKETGYVSRLRVVDAWFRVL